MDTSEGKETGPAGIERRVGAGIRLKLFGILLPLVFLLITAVTLMVMEVTKSTLRRDLLQRGAAISRVVALSAGHSLLAKDPWDWTGWSRKRGERSRHRLRRHPGHLRHHGGPRPGDGEGETVPSRSAPAPVGTFGDTQADEVVRDGRRLIEYTTRSLSRDGAWGSPPSDSPWRVSRPRSGRSGT